MNVYAAFAAFVMFTAICWALPVWLVLFITRGHPDDR